MVMDKKKVLLTRKTTDGILVVQDYLRYQSTTDELEVMLRLPRLGQA